MKLADARIGYAGYSPDFSAPGDRRRFCAYASSRGLTFGRADLSLNPDLVVVTHNGDIPGWNERKRRGDCDFRFVFELADSYLTRIGLADRYVKSVARRLLGTDSRGPPDFLGTLTGACELADAVICSTGEQAEMIARYNPNVFTSFDWFGDDVGDEEKVDYRRGSKLRIVWEGQSTTLKNLRSIREVINEVHDKVELHVVTDPEVYRWFNRFAPHPAQDLLQGFECDVHFHPWTRATFSKQITNADLAVIPLNPDDAFALGKPENKLVMLWQLGMPVLASDTPAYRRAMAGAGLDMLCGNAADWRTKLQSMIAASDSERERLGRQGREFAKRAYSKEEFLARFDRVFTSMGYDV